jgi:hypothetical protein
LAGGLLTRDELFERYEEAAGLSVDGQRLRWFSVLANYSAVVKTLATSMRVARLGRSHQDVLLARLAPVLVVQHASRIGLRRLVEGVRRARPPRLSLVKQVASAARGSGPR